MLFSYYAKTQRELKHTVKDKSFKKKKKQKLCKWTVYLNFFEVLLGTVIKVIILIAQKSTFLTKVQMTTQVVTIWLPAGFFCLVGLGLTFLRRYFLKRFFEECNLLTVSKQATQCQVALTTTDTGTAAKFSWKGSPYVTAHRLKCQ